MIKINYIIIMIVLLSHCSLDTKSGIWENKQSIKEEKQLTKISFDKDLSFNEFRENVIFYGKNSKFPNVIDE